MKDAKERFDSCMELCKYWASRHDARRQTEWRISLAIWALLVSAIVYLERNSLTFWLIPLVPVGYTFLFLRGVWVANTHDQEQAEHFERAAVQILDDPNYIIPARPPKIGGWRKYLGFLSRWAMQFQIIVTVFLTALIYVLPQIASAEHPEKLHPLPDPKNGGVKIERPRP